MADTSWVFIQGFLQKKTILVAVLPITRPQILDSSKLKEFADNNFKFNKNGRKLSKWLENTVVKGEIAGCEQFLLFPQCFQEAGFPAASKGIIEWEWVNPLPHNLEWTTLKIMRFEWIMGKGENAGCYGRPLLLASLVQIPSNSSISVMQFIHLFLCYRYCS